MKVTNTLKQGTAPKKTKLSGKTKKRTRKPNPNRKRGSVPVLSFMIEEGAPFEKIQKLVDAGASVSLGDGTNERPLHYAAAAGDVPEVVKLLLERGANPLGVNSAKMTPLQMARKMQAGEETIKLLTEAEAAKRAQKEKN